MDFTINVLVGIHPKVSRVSDVLINRCVVFIRIASNKCFATTEVLMVCHDIVKRSK